eukprot:jgi/Bigna1/66992/fgenesh1_pg.2_\
MVVPIPSLRFWVLILVLTFSTIPHGECFATRQLYVDDTDELIVSGGANAMASTLFSLAVAYNFTVMHLYDLHRIMPYSGKKADLKAFMDLGRNAGVNFVAVGESLNNFQQARSFCVEFFSEYPNHCFQAYNLEFEFWVPSSVQAGGVYCESYLTPNGYACNSDGAFDFWITHLANIRNSIGNQAHLTAYIGWPSSVTALTEAEVYSRIVGHTDSLLIHAYRVTPDDTFSFTRSRLLGLKQAAEASSKSYNVSIIFSAESGFMGPWLASNSLSAAEDIYLSSALEYTPPVFGSCCLEQSPFTWFSRSNVVSRVPVPAPTTQPTQLPSPASPPSETTQHPSSHPSVTAVPTPRSTAQPNYSLSPTREPSQSPTPSPLRSTPIEVSQSLVHFHSVFQAVPCAELAPMRLQLLSFLSHLPAVENAIIKNEGCGSLWFEAEVAFSSYGSASNFAENMRQNQSAVFSAQHGWNSSSVPYISHIQVFTGEDGGETSGEQKNDSYGALNLLLIAGISVAVALLCGFCWYWGLKRYRAAKQNTFNVDAIRRSSRLDIVAASDSSALCFVSKQNNPRDNVSFQ